MAVQNENVSINIGSTFDAKGFKQAETAADKLNRTVKNLATTIGVAYGAAAVANFGKQSVKAFLADEEAATKLANAVKNLGMEFANPYISDYIAKLEATSKVADDQLRPAFQALLQQTGSLSDSQKILSTAIETSRGSGVDLATVANDLAQAYVGNTKGLKKYYLGLTTAQIKAKSFTEIQKIMNDQFAGSNTAYLNTYSGQVGVLSLAWQNFQEKVGGTLLTLASFGDGSDGHKLNLLAATLDKIGSAIQLIGKGKEAVFGLFDVTGKSGLLSKFNPYPQGGTGSKPKDTNISKYDAALKKIEDDRRRQNAIILKNQKANTAELKKQAALKKAGTIFDIDQIQLIAALKGKLSDEDRKRAELQLALLNENDVLATSLTKQILMAQDATGGLYKYFLTIGDTKINNPFAFLDTWIKDFQSKLNALKIPDLSQPSTYTGQGIDPNIAALGVVAGYGAGTPMTVANQASTILGNGSYGMQSTAGFVDTSAVTGTNVKVYVSGSVVTEQELIDAIQSGLQSNSLSGAPSQIGRIAGMFG
jgi:hypothetical protein